MIQIGNAPCSWGILEFDLDGQVADYTQVLDEMKETGYAGTELGDWGFMPTDPNLLRNELEQRQLKLLGAFVPVAFAETSQHEAGVQKALQTADLMAQAGFQEAFIVLADDNGKDERRRQNAGRIKPEMSLTDRQWQVFANGVHKAARAVKEKVGLRSVFHHHCAGFVETTQEIQKLMDITEPELIGLCLDMGHYRFGGGDPLQALKQFASRIWHVHFKDCQPEVADRARKKSWDYFESVRQGVFCELGQGEVDFKSIVDELQKIKYNGWIVVEQDVLPGMGTPKVCAEHNRKFIRGLGL